jgi:ribosomal protein S18 acetylase RimI-like enzyme
MLIRPFESDDWPGVWRIVEPVFRAGATFPNAVDTDEAEAHRYWVEAPMATWVAVDNQHVVRGIYYLRANQPPLGGHVANCGYVVDPESRGQGIGSALCIHSQDEATRQGFRAMQYNLVVTTNEAGVRLWQRHGFHIVGTLPGAFRHAELGFVDAYVMYKVLVH